MKLDLRKMFVLLAALTALIASGCGGDDEDGGGGGEALSEEDYATEINGILTTFGEESVSLGTELSSASSPEDLQSGVDELSGLTESLVGDLNDIEPPEAASEAHDTLTAALEGYLEDIETLADAVDTDDPAQAQEAALEFQEAALEVQSDLQEAATQLQESGIEPPSGEAGG